MIFARRMKKNKKDTKKLKTKKEENKKMANTKYRSKRCKVGITPYTMAKELGINYKKYMEIDRGERPLEGTYVDKFNKAIEKATEIKFERAKRMIKVNEFLKDKEQVKKKMKECGITCVDLGKILDVSQSTAYRATLEKNEDASVSSDLKEMVYDFLNDPLNKKIKGSKTSQKETNTELKSDDSTNIFKQEKSVENGSIDAENSDDVCNNENVENSVDENADNADKDNKESNESEDDIKIDFENATENEKMLLNVITVLKKGNEKLLEENRHLSKENAEILQDWFKCKHQIEMYEILISKLK